jgi:hypothetical protein
MQKLLVAEGVVFSCDGDTLVVINEGNEGSNEHRIPLGKEAARRVTRLVERPCTVDELVDGLLTSPDGMRQLAFLAAGVRDLTSSGLINQVVEIDGAVAARVVKKGRLPWRQDDVPSDAVVARHVVATSTQGWVTLDSGLACGLVKVVPSIAGLVLAGEQMEIGEKLRPLRELLWRAGLLTSPLIEKSLDHSMWNPVDLLMMERASDSAADFRYGGTYRYLDVYSPPPLVDPIRADEIIKLPEPDPNRWFRHDEPFGLITERRRSTFIFQRDSVPTLNQLTNVLHRSARIQQRLTDDKGMELSRRPVAGGGALHELDLYILVDHVKGLAQGLWRYNPADNVLEKVHCLKDSSELTDEVMRATWSRVRPPATIVMVARFGRVMWKYEGVGAALVLKDTGVLMHALQLAAVAEGLGACPLGSNFAYTFEQITGLGFPSHGPVGQLILGLAKEEE